MKVIDLNVLLYVVNEDAPHHATVLSWWKDALRADESICLPWIVIVGFLRLATNRRVFPSALTVAAASQKIDTWLGLPLVRVVEAQPGHWSTLSTLIKMSGTAGNLATDSHLAALAITHRATLVSCDTDFARFTGLKWVSPLK